MNYFGYTDLYSTSVLESPRAIDNQYTISLTGWEIPLDIQHD